MNLLLTGAFRYTDEQIEYIKSLGHQVVYIQDERVPITFDVSDIEGVVCNGLFLYTPIEKFSSLKYIQLTSAGLDRVPLDYITQNNIKIFNARGVYSIPMAEFALCGVLDLYKKSRAFYNSQLAHQWQKQRELMELCGKRVCIIGAGNIGCHVAKRFKAFDSTVVGVDIVSNNQPYFDCVYLMDNLDEQLALADIVVLTLPLTQDNKGFFDSTKFALMRENSVLVNIARGALVNQNDMIEALTNGSIYGAVLDVFETEPLEENSPLWDMPNVILTPHNSFVGEHNNQRMFDAIIENLKENTDE